MNASQNQPMKGPHYFKSQTKSRSGELYFYQFKT